MQLTEIQPGTSYSEKISVRLSPLQRQNRECCIMWGVDITCPAVSFPHILWETEDYSVFISSTETSGVLMVTGSGA